MSQRAPRQHVPKPQAPDLPQDVVSCAIQAGATPRAVECAVTERGQDDTLLMLARETAVSLLIVGALAERWGIAPRLRGDG